MILGLTGAFGGGKSTVLHYFEEKGWYTFDADAACHKLYDAAIPELIDKVKELFGNSAVRFAINTLFRSRVRDVMTGCRAFSYEFVKTFPVLSAGFEIETEMTIHALDKNMKLDHVVIPYRDRPDGSVSKLNTVRDGLRVLRTIGGLHRTYKPASFFGIIAAVLMLLAVGFFIPVLADYLRTGLVLKFPTLIVCGFTALASLLSFFTGLQLENAVKKNKQDFELARIDANRHFRALRGEGKRRD